MGKVKRYVLSEEADKDIEAIFDYSEQQFGVNKAIEYVTEIDTTFIHLMNNPEIGRIRKEIKVGLRSFPIASHIIFYTIFDEHIRIIRVLHGSQDYPRFFD